MLVNFDGTASSDPNPGDTLTYRWDLDGDGQLDDSTSPQPTFTYTTPGVVMVTLEVTDSTGLKDTDTIEISVDNALPTAVIDSPSSGLLWKVGDTINFSGHADDVDEVGGVLPPSALLWEINLLHCPGGDCHSHPITSFNGIDSGSFIAPDHEYPSQLEIILTATDPVTSFQDTQSIVLNPQTTVFTFDSNPSGLELNINGAADITPFDFSVIVGSDNLITAPSPQTVGQSTYVFDSWSDNGARSHNIVAGTQPQTFVATFDASSVTPFDTTDDGLGTITAQGEIGVFQGKGKAFDNDPVSKWLDFANQDPSTRSSWIQYQYANGDRYVLSSYTITSGNDNPPRDPRDWTLSGSNDGVTFVPLDTRTNEVFSGRTQKRTFTFTGGSGYNIYRLDINSVANPANANSVQIGEIELIGVPQGAVGTPSVTLFADDPTAGEGTPADPGRFTVTRAGDLSGNLTVNYAISGTASSGDYTQTLSGTVTIPDQSAAVTIDITPVDDPQEEGNESLTLTLQSGSGYQVGTPASGTITIVDNDSSVTPFDTTDDGLGTITAQGEIGVFQGKGKAFDNDPISKWLDFANQDPSTRSSWIQYQYANGDRYVLSSYTITSGNDNPPRDPRDWTLSGSNDGVTFVPLDTRTNEVFSGRTQKRTFTFAGGSGYNIYRLDINSVANPANANSVQIGEIELIGVPQGAGPIANDDSGTGFVTDEDTSLSTANVLNNDIGQAISVSGFDTTATVGLVTNNGDGTFDYDPNGQFESLAVGESVTDTFSYTIIDGDGGSSSADVTITVNGANDPPIAVDDFVSVAEDSTYDGNVLWGNPESWVWSVPVISEDQVNNSPANPPGDGTTDSPATGSATIEITRNPDFVLGLTNNPDEEYLISVNLAWDGLVGELTKVHVHGWLTPGGDPVGPGNSTPTHLYEIPGLENESAVIASGVNRTSDTYVVNNQFLPHTHAFDDTTSLISPKQIIDELVAGLRLLQRPLDIASSR